MTDFARNLPALLTRAGIGEEIYAVAADLYPICRSITGNGVRETLGRLSALAPLDISEVPSGTTVFDWTVPREWNIHEAWIKDPQGRKIVDLAAHSLHVVSYSVPVHRRMTLAELRPYLHSLPGQPDLIPYRTSYYAENWGFCLTHHQLESLVDGTYEVMIDSTLADGALTYGEHLHKGRSNREVLLSAHVCHPSLANDNCAGLALLAHLAKAMQGIETNYSYRFLFAPGTIGAITWLARNEAGADRIDHGIVMSCVGDGGGPVYKKSRRGDALVDRAMTHLLRKGWPVAEVQEFSPYGYDERQYCSPGFNLAVGLFQRSQYGTFPEYHTSGDNLSFIKPEFIEQSYRLIVDAIDIIEHDTALRSLSPKCEPQLGKRGLYHSIGGDRDAPAKNMATLWILNLADGHHTLLDIADRASLPFAVIRETTRRLVESGLVVPTDRIK